MPRRLHCRHHTDQSITCRPTIGATTPRAPTCVASFQSLAWSYLLRYFIDSLSQVVSFISNPTHLCCWPLEDKLIVRVSFPAVALELCNVLRARACAAAEATAEPPRIVAHKIVSLFSFIHFHHLLRAYRPSLPVAYQSPVWPQDHFASLSRELCRYHVSPPPRPTTRRWT